MKDRVGSGIVAVLACIVFSLFQYAIMKELNKQRSKIVTIPIQVDNLHYMSEQLYIVCSNQTDKINDLQNQLNYFNKVVAVQDQFIVDAIMSEMGSKKFETFRVKWIEEHK